MEQNAEINKQLFAKRLKEARGGMVKSAFAKKCGVSENTYIKWEKGEGGLSLYNAYKIASESGVSLDWLVGLVGDDKKFVKRDETERMKIENYWDAYEILTDLVNRFFKSFMQVESHTFVRLSSDSNLPKSFSRKELVLHLFDEHLVYIQEEIDTITEHEMKEDQMIGSRDIWQNARRGLEVKMKEMPLPNETYQKMSKEEWNKMMCLSDVIDEGEKHGESESYSE